MGKSSFSVDGLYPGMPEKEFFVKKLINKDGKVKDDLLGGNMDALASELSYGGVLCGEFFGYKTKILDKEATVVVFLTAKSKQIYAVMVEWDNLSTREAADMLSSVNKSLDTKYGKRQDIDTQKIKTSPIQGSQWTPKDKAIIYTWHAMSPPMKLRPVVIYIDNKYSEMNKDELKVASTTKKL